MAVIDRFKSVVKNFLDIGNIPTVKEASKEDKKARLSARVRQKMNLVFKQDSKSAMQIDRLVQAVALAKMPPYYSRYYLYELYEHIIDDADVYSETETRNNKTLAEEFSIVDKQGNESKELTELLRALWFDKFVKHALDANYYGHSLVELDEFDSEGYATGVTLMDRIFVNPQLGVILDYPANPINGVLYRGNEHLIEIGEPKDLGLLRICGKHAIWKQYSYTDWSRLSEKYGIPLLLLFLDSTDEAEITATLEAMRNIGSNGVGSLSASDKAEFLQMSNTDPYKIFQESDAMHSNKISKIISGQSDATNSNASGSFARAETHLSILNDRVRADMRRISYLVNDSLFPMLIRKSPKYKGLENHRFVYKSIEDEKLVRNSALQSTLNPPPTNNQPPNTNKQSYDFFA